MPQVQLVTRQAKIKTLTEPIIVDLQQQRSQSSDVNEQSALDAMIAHLKSMVLVATNDAADPCA